MDKYRKDFDLLTREIHGKPLAYLDNAATTLKPNAVIDAVTEHYRFEASNVHRGVHFLSEQATIKFEKARQKTQHFIGASAPEEIIFTAGTTASINLLARSISLIIKPGDEILISELEHHSNIVPWQLFCKANGAILRRIPMLESGELDTEAYFDLLSHKTKVVAITMVSNALGTVNPIKAMTDAAHEVSALVVVDAAQAVAHLKVDVRELGCDFLAFSAHKIFGPTGVGVLYGKKDLLEMLPPAFGGGGMIRTVSIEESTYAQLPAKFEAGTPHIAGVLGLGSALDYVSEIGIESIAAYEHDLENYCRSELSGIPGVNLIANPKVYASIFSFTIDGIHPHDVGSLLDQEGVAIRSGHHCCQPVMNFFKLPATSRASLAFYTTRSDVDQLCAAIQKAQEIFR